MDSIVRLGSEMICNPSFGGAKRSLFARIGFVVSQVPNVDLRHPQFVRKAFSLCNVPVWQWRFRKVCRTL
jgi:hypothetical protein